MAGSIKKEFETFLQRKRGKLVVSGRRDGKEKKPVGSWNRGEWASTEVCGEKKRNGGEPLRGTGGGAHLRRTVKSESLLGGEGVSGL